MKKTNQGDGTQWEVAVTLCCCACVSSCLRRKHAHYFVILILFQSPFTIVLEWLANMVPEKQ